ncbi:MAG: DMT family transporter [Clostridia bacterium]|nr:DMT family transporter [Clostridia bacterium]
MVITRQVKADFLLLVVAAIWGLTFVVVKNALDDIQPFTFNAYRFLVAGIFMIVICIFYKIKFNRLLLKIGTIIGFFLFLGYSFQTIGLQYTTASNSGFITGLAVVFVPLFATIFTKKLPGMYSIAGAVLAAIGLFFLSVDSTLTYNSGDIMTLFGAICFAVYILLLGKYSPQFDTIPLVAMQIFVVAFLSLICSLTLETPSVTMTSAVIIALLVCAIPATCLAFMIQTWAQKFTTPTRTIIIITTEPVFAALFAYMLLGEIFTTRHLLGAVLMLMGILLVEFKGETQETAVNVDD